VVFRRRRQRDAEHAADPAVGVYDTDADTELDDGTDRDSGTPAPAHGPWDVADLDDPAKGRVDLGGLLIPAVQGMELRAEIADDQVVAATVVIADSMLQLAPFAAPRSEGIWDDLRGELAATFAKQGGTADESDGPFGAELRARVPATAAGGRTRTQPARIIGIDGPRWFLRALITGRAVTEPATARRVEELLKDVVVVRGDSPMAPRDPIPLRLPQESSSEGGSASPEAGGQRPPLDPFHRGPEITEVR
jgi:hypothetical protein